MSKHVIRMPGGGFAFVPAGDAEAAQRVVDARHEFVVGYWKDAGAGVSTVAILVGGEPE